MMIIIIITITTHVHTRTMQVLSFEPKTLEILRNRIMHDFFDAPSNFLVGVG